MTNEKILTNRSIIYSGCGCIYHKVQPISSWYDNNCMEFFKQYGFEIRLCITKYFDILKSTAIYVYICTFWYNQIHLNERKLPFCI